VKLADKVEALRQCPLLASLPRRALKQIARAGTEVDVPAGAVLIEPGMQGAGMFLILDGTVSVERRRSRFEYGPGAVVGELALLTDTVRTARVRAKTPVRCLAIARDDFRRLLVAEPRLALGILDVVAGRLAERD
jgi:CRP-like cAMP-binding protein